MRSQARAPLAMAAAAFACGDWLAGHLLRSPAAWGWAGALLALCTIAAVLGRSTRLAQLSSVLAMLCAGSFAHAATPGPRNVLPPPEFLDSGTVEIVGHITNDGVLLAAGPRARFDLETECIQLEEAKFSRPFGLRVTIFSREDEEEVAGAAVRKTSALQY